MCITQLQVNTYFHWKTCICFLIKQLLIDNRHVFIQTNHWGKYILINNDLQTQRKAFNQRAEMSPSLQWKIL